MSNAPDGGVERHLRTRGLGRGSRSTKIVAAVLSLTLAFPLSPMVIDQAQAEVEEAMATVSAQHAQVAGGVDATADEPAAAAETLDDIGPYDEAVKGVESSGATAQGGGFRCGRRDPVRYGNRRGVGSAVGRCDEGSVCRYAGLGARQPVSRRAHHRVIVRTA